MAADGGLAVRVGRRRGRGAAGVPTARRAWIVPRVKAVAPLVSRAGWVIAVTDAEIVAIRAKDGEVVWRHAAGGVRLPPDDRRRSPLRRRGRRPDPRADARRRARSCGRVTCRTASAPSPPTAAASTPAPATSSFYCLDATSGQGAVAAPHRVAFPPAASPWTTSASTSRRSTTSSTRSIAATATSAGRAPIRRRPIAGVVVAGHVVFVPAVGVRTVHVLRPRRTAERLRSRCRREIQRDTPPDMRETPAGVNVFAVTGGLTNEWQLTYRRARRRVGDRAVLGADRAAGRCRF